MSELETFRAFFGWCTAINFGLLMVTTIVLTSMRGLLFKIHTRLFGLDEAYWSRAYVQYLSQYKIAIIVFNLVPYIALEVMS